MRNKFFLISILCLLLITTASYANVTVGVGCTIPPCTNCMSGFTGTWTSSDTTIATVNATTGDITGIGTGSTTVSFTFTSGGCGSGVFVVNVDVVTAMTGASISETSPIALPSGEEAYTYCSSGSLTLHVTTVPSGLTGVTYTWNDGSTVTGPMVSPDFTPTFTTTTTAVIHNYTVTINYAGCTTTTTVNVVVPPTGCSPCDYYNVNAYLTNDLQPTIATSVCPTCSTLQVFHTIISGAISGANSTNNNNYYIVNNATISRSLIIGDQFFMNGGVSLEVIATFGATIRNSHFSSSSSCMWNGINVDVNGSNAGRLMLMNCLVENAGNGMTGGVNIVPSGGSFYTPSMPPILNSINSVFNSNFCGIFVNGYAPPISSAPVGTILPISVNSSVFTYRDLASHHLGGSVPTAYYPFSWPGSGYLRTIVGSPTAPDPSFSLDSFTALTYSPTSPAGHAGIYLGNSCANVLVTPGSGTTTPNIYNYNYIQIGNSSPDPFGGNTNVFDNMTFGTQIENANTYFYNNTFRRVNYGVGITNNLVNDVEVVGNPYTTGDNTNNRFHQIYQIGVYNGSTTNGNAVPTDFGCVNAQFTSTTLSTGNTAIDLELGNTTGSTVVPGYHNIYQVSRNYIYNYSTGIHVNYPGSGPASAGCNGFTYITNNNIVGKTSYSSPEEVFYGIQVTDIGRSYTGTTGNGVVKIYQNNLQGPRFGIEFSSTSLSAAIMNDTVNLVDYGSTTSLATTEEKGIWVTTSPFLAAVDDNIVGGWGYSCPTTGIGGGWNSTGIFVENVGSASLGSLVDMSCNTVHDVYNGFDFRLASNLRWNDNQMMRNTYGMILNGGAASIGQQGSTCNPSDNHWDDGTFCTVCGTATCAAWPGWTSPSVYQTYVNAGSGPFGSILYFRTTPGAAPTYYNIFNNGAAFPVAVYSLTVTLIDASVGCSTSLPSLPVCATVPGFRPAHPTGPIVTTVPGGIYNLFPNPSDGNLVITQTVPAPGIINATVLNSLGQAVYSSPLQFTGGKASISLPNVVPGMYQVQLSDGKAPVWNTKVVIEKSSLNK